MKPISKDMIAKSLKSAYNSGKKNLPVLLKEKIPVSLEKAKSAAKFQDYRYYRNLYDSMGGKQKFINNAEKQLSRIGKSMKSQSRNPAVNQFRSSDLAKKTLDLSKAKQVISDKADKSLLSKIVEDKKKEFTQGSSQNRVDFANLFSKSKSISPDDLLKYQGNDKKIGRMLGDIDSYKDILHWFDLKIDPSAESILNAKNSARDASKKFYYAAIPSALLSASLINNKLKNKKQNKKES